MVKKEISPILLVIVLIAGFLLLQNNGFFSIIMQSPQVQYYNEPIEARFSLTNFTNPTITAYFNDAELFERPSNESNQNVIFSTEIINSSYVYKISNVTQEGLFKIIAKEGNKTETQVIEVKRPYVDIKHDIESVIEEGTLDKINIKTFTPQGEPIESDINIYVINPDNSQTIITPTKLTSNEYEFTFTYAKAGNYQFKIAPSKTGYDTKEFTIITSVTKSAGVHPIIYIWFGAVAIWLILFVIRRFRK